MISRAQCVEGFVGLFVDRRDANTPMIFITARATFSLCLRCVELPQSAIMRIEVVEQFDTVDESQIGLRIEQFCVGSGQTEMFRENLTTHCAKLFHWSSRASCEGRQFDAERLTCNEGGVNRRMRA